MDRTDAFANPEPALFPAREVRTAQEDRLTRVLADAQERVARGSVVPTIDLERFRKELSAVDFYTARPLTELLDWTVQQLEEGVVHLNHPRYFGLFNPAPTFPAVCADRLVAAFNPQLATWTTSPVPVEIENHVIAALAARAGLPLESRGHFTSGGSEANLSAVLCALTMANEHFAQDGARAFAGPVVFYASAESHLAWVKIAHQVGIGRSAVRLVATDGSGKMSCSALREALALDRAQGRIPVMIAATAGTTNAGMIDPLEECAAIARHEGIWYHVDAAWGGAALASERFRGALAGIALADSITIDAHKWFATTMACGMFITRRAAALDAAFQVSTTFMPSNRANLDPYVSSVQWSRRFLGLRLFLSLAAAGWSGYGVHVDRAIGLIDRVRHDLAERHWRIANNSVLAVLCVEAPPGSAAVSDIAKRVVASGRAWVAAATLEGRPVIRICATHGELGETDVSELVAVLEAAKSAAP
jgi:aromatic-L-amino-acid decarboxylase